MSKLDDFMVDFEKILIKHGFKREVFVVNMDNNKLIGDFCLGSSEDGHLLIGISLTGKNACPCCKKESEEQ